MKILGAEGSFPDLLVGEVDPHILKRISNSAVDSVLDVGCDHAWGLLLMYYLFGCGHLEGIEHWGVQDVTKNMVKFLRKGGVTIQEETIERVWEEIKTDGTDVKPQILDRKKFWEILKVTYGLALEQYSLLRKHYDLLVLSNVVHYWDRDRARMNLERLSAVVDSTSLIYLRVRLDYPNAPMSAAELLDVCREFANRWSLKEHAHSSDAPVISHYTFSNI